MSEETLRGKERIPTVGLGTAIGEFAYGIHSKIMRDCDTPDVAEAAEKVINEPIAERVECSRLYTNLDLATGLALVNCYGLESPAPLDAPFEMPCVNALSVNMCSSYIFELLRGMAQIGSDTVCNAGSLLEYQRISDYSSSALNTGGERSHAVYTGYVGNFAKTHDGVFLLSMLSVLAIEGKKSSGEYLKLSDIQELFGRYVADKTDDGRGHTKYIDLVSPARDAFFSILSKDTVKKIVEGYMLAGLLAYTRYVSCKVAPHANEQFRKAAMREYMTRYHGISFIKDSEGKEEPFYLFERKRVFKFNDNIVPYALTIVMNSHSFEEAIVASLTNSQSCNALTVAVSTLAESVFLGSVPRHLAMSTLRSLNKHLIEPLKSLYEYAAMEQPFYGVLPNIEFTGSTRPISHPGDLSTIGDARVKRTSTAAYNNLCAFVQNYRFLGLPFAKYVSDDNQIVYAQPGFGVYEVNFDNGYMYRREEGGSDDCLVVPPCDILAKRDNILRSAYVLMDNATSLRELINAAGDDGDFAARMGTFNSLLFDAKNCITDLEGAVRTDLRAMLSDKSEAETHPICASLDNIAGAIICTKRLLADIGSDYNASLAAPKKAVTRYIDGIYTSTVNLIQSLILECERAFNSRKVNNFFNALHSIIKGLMIKNKAISDYGPDNMSAMVTVLGALTGVFNVKQGVSFSIRPQTVNYSSKPSAFKVDDKTFVISKSGTVKGRRFKTVTPYYDVFRALRATYERASYSFSAEDMHADDNSRIIIDIITDNVSEAFINDISIDPWGELPSQFKEPGKALSWLMKCIRNEYRAVKAAELPDYKASDAYSAYECMLGFITCMSELTL